MDIISSNNVKIDPNPEDELARRVADATQHHRAELATAEDTMPNGIKEFVFNPIGALSAFVRREYHTERIRQITNETQDNNPDLVNFEHKMYVQRWRASNWISNTDAAEEMAYSEKPHRDKAIELRSSIPKGLDVARHPIKTAKLVANSNVEASKAKASAHKAQEKYVEDQMFYDDKNTYLPHVRKDVEVALEPFRRQEEQLRSANRQRVDAAGPSRIFLDPTLFAQGFEDHRRLNEILHQAIAAKRRVENSHRENILRPGKKHRRESI